MKPVAYDFRFPRGGRPFLAVRLTGRDPRTGETRRLPVPGVTIEWAVDWPTEPEVRTQFSAPNLLMVDRRTGFVVFPISDERVEELEGQPGPVSTRIRILMPDGTPVPYLTGTIAMED